MTDGARIVDVTFVDADTGQVFLQLKFPARALPESFATATTLNLGKDDWQVVEATPTTAAEFVERGALTLRVRKLQRIDPKDILFSLPTIADGVPKAVPGGPSALLKLQEDDWLQFELLPLEVEGRIRPDLEAVANVLATARKGPGFERLHVRRALPVPFSDRVLNVAALEARFGAAGAVAWHGHEGVLDGCFAFAVAEGGFLYGQSDGPRVASLGVTHPGVAALRAEEKLVLVDWCRASIVG